MAQNCRKDDIERTGCWRRTESGEHTDRVASTFVPDWTRLTAPAANAMVSTVAGPTYDVISP